MEGALTIEGRGPQLGGGYLEYLTEPADLVEADEGAGECGEGQANVGATFVADGKTAEAVDPGEGAFDDPPVFAEPLAALDATSCNPRSDAADAALLAAAAMIVGLVGAQFARPAAGASPSSSPNARYGIQGGGQHAAIVAVGAAQCQAKRCAAGVRDEMTLGARLAAVGRVRADLRAPFLAPMLALSRAARDQSIASAA